MKKRVKGTAIPKRFQTLGNIQSSYRGFEEGTTAWSCRVMLYSWTEKAYTLSLVTLLNFSLIEALNGGLSIGC